MAAVPSASMLSRLTRPMVVGPFRPAMRRASVVESSCAASLEAASEEAASLELQSRKRQSLRCRRRLPGTAQAERQQQRYKFLHDVLFLPAGVPFPAWEPVQTLQCKILQGKFAKIFALRVLVYYNREENTVAHATELQEDCGGRCVPTELR